MEVYDSMKFEKILRNKKLSLTVPKNSNLQDYYDAGVIKKEDLIDGEYYNGISRDTSFAQWNSKDNCFYYMRNKSGYSYKEDKNHIADDNGWDLFIPFLKFNNVE